MILHLTGMMKNVNFSTENDNAGDMDNNKESGRDDSDCHNRSDEEFVKILKTRRLEKDKLDGQRKEQDLESLETNSDFDSSYEVG